MKKCLKCDEEIDEDHNYCEECAYERLKKYIEELYEKQVKKENG